MEVAKIYRLNPNRIYVNQPIPTASVTTAPKPKLLDQVHQAIRTRHYSPKTEEAYIGWIKRYIFFHNKRHPLEMAEAEIAQFLSNLATKSRVSGSTQNQALNALLFLYHHVLGKEIGYVNGVVRAKKAPRLPVVLTRGEVQALLSYLDGCEKIMATLLYGAGLRLMECCRLRVKDIDFSKTRSSYALEREIRIVTRCFPRQSKSCSSSTSTMANDNTSMMSRRT